MFGVLSDEPKGQRGIILENSKAQETPGLWR
jgi:hypothetical protein